MGDIGGDPQQGSRDVDPDPPLTPRLAHRHLHQIARRGHRQKDNCKSDACSAVVAAIAKLGRDVSAPDQTDGKDEQRRRDDVEVLDVGLPGVVDHRPLVGGRHQIPHPGVDQPGS
jgi:hypothetical protein